MNQATTMLATLALLATALTLAAIPASAQDPAFDSGNLASGDSFSWTPEEPGTYGYHCAYHSSMTGTITVNDGEAGQDVEIEIDGFAFQPADVTVTTGTTITWTNLDDTGHTVTADEDAGSTEEDDGSTEGDDGAMDSQDDGGMMADDGTADSPGPGLIALIAGLAVASLIVAGRRS